MKRCAGLFALVFAAAATALPAFAATNFVQDQAGMFSAGTVSALQQRIGAFNAQTGKEIVVVTTPSLGGATLQQAAEQAFTQQNVNGVLIYIARDDRKDIIVPDAAGVRAGWFTPDVIRSIRTTMESQFKTENYDGGITSAVEGILNVYRAHVGSLHRTGGATDAGVAGTTPGLPSTGGFHLSMFWLIVLIVIGFLVIRAIIRAFSTPRYGGPGMMGGPGGMPGAGGMPPGGYGPGYGGYGYGGGGGSFWSGLLGGLGGAWLGNEMFRGGGFGGGGIADASQGGVAPTGDAGGGNVADAGGWGNDAGQADMGGASAGDWSGGGFGGDGGGGFGGGDFGGGGGDSGGGW
jgi:uncharacterized membrane protein YgcG